MKILFLTLCDFKNLDERLIYTDLMKEFVSAGHTISIVSPRERKYREQTHLLVFEHHKILKVRIGNTQKTNLIERGITTILLQHQFLSAIKKYFINERFDLVLYSTPPVTFAKVIRFIKKRDSAASYLMLKDIFPQNAVDIGMFSKQSVFYKYFRRKEIELYSLSDYIGCMSEANVKYLLSNNSQIAPKSVEVCPNSIIPVEINKSNKWQIRDKYNLPHQSVIFFYGGNFGKPQAIDFIIKVLKENANKIDRHFVMCGSGTEFYKLQKYYSSEKPKNITLVNGLPKPDYDKLMSASDVGLIFLDNRYTIPNFPSRLLPYMEYSLPVIAATDSNTDIGKVIVDGGFGWWCESSQTNEFTSILNSICSNKSKILSKGSSARDYLERNYTARISYQIIIQHFIENQ